MKKISFNKSTGSLFHPLIIFKPTQKIKEFKKNLTMLIINKNKAIFQHQVDWDKIQVKIQLKK